MYGRAAQRYEVSYKSRGWRNWSLANHSDASMMDVAPVDPVRGSVLTTRMRGSGKVVVRDVSTKKVVRKLSVDEHRARSVMDGIIEDLERLSILAFQAKWGIEGPL
jgi:hypothetical protein